jgi:hypothetical protein
MKGERIMRHAPRIGLSNMADTTQFAPLAAIGSYVRSSDMLSPLFSRMSFSQPTHTVEPTAALVDLWVSILAGCRSVREINTRIRPDLNLALSWGRRQFAEQSTIARVLDSMEAEQANQMRESVTQIFHWMSQTSHHDWSRPLVVDIDLTPLPAGRTAVGSTKGYFKEKGGAVVSFVALALRPITKPSGLGSIPVIP